MGGISPTLRADMGIAVSRGEGIHCATGGFATPFIRTNLTLLDVDSRYRLIAFCLEESH